MSVTALEIELAAYMVNGFLACNGDAVIECPRLFEHVAGWAAKDTVAGSELYFDAREEADEMLMATNDYEGKPRAVVEALLALKEHFNL